MSLKSEGKVAVIDEIAAYYLGEYNTRLRLSKLGFKEDLEKLDCITAEAFCLISSEIDYQRSLEMKKKR